MGEVIHILYTNYRGETAWRRIYPSHIHYGVTSYHPQSQWLLVAYDLDKKADRDFAMKDIRRWQTEPPPDPHIPTT